MIPCIEDIIDSLLAGTMTRHEAIAYIERHIELAEGCATREGTE